MVKQKPELLAPVGNVESFYAALNAGADAVYLGLQEFNARGRASNFTRPLLQLAVLKAREKNVKVYVTLNVLIKNREIDQLIDVLAFLDAVKVNGVIIQDWGTYYLAKKYFPRLVFHASTQMGNHNSVGVNYSASKELFAPYWPASLPCPNWKLLPNTARPSWKSLFMGHCAILFRECVCLVAIPADRGPIEVFASKVVVGFIRVEENNMLYLA
jgi:hypothetical protein